jgi:hypothetical protein
MQITEENMTWAIEQLSGFSEYRRFPAQKRTLRLHAEHLLNVVHNDTFPNLIRKYRSKQVPFTEEEEQKWLAKVGLTADVNDVKWLMSTLLRECDEYPLPPVVRRTYQRLMRPADGIEIPDLPDGDYGA